MRFSDDTFATLLLTMALSPDREEYVHPLQAAEFFRLSAKLRDAGHGNVGRLIGMDISGLMLEFGMEEEQAYRLFVLLNRGVQVSYALENFADKGIYPVTWLDEEYPSRIRHRMEQYAPPFFYYTGEPERLSAPHLGVLGLTGIKTSDAARKNVECIGSMAEQLGYRVLCGDEPGVPHIAFAAAGSGNARTAILGGGLSKFAAEHPGECALSVVHPDSLFTQSHAAERNRLLLATCDAAFIMNTDMKRGETEAISRSYCDHVYAWDGWPMNGLLISRGATPFAALTPEILTEMSARWVGAHSEQINIFDMLDM